MRFLYLFSLLAFLTASCGNSSSQSDGAETSEAEKLRQRMVTLHDEVMPLMGPMNKVGNKLGKQLDKIQDKDLQESANAIVKNLDKAHEDMMDWMNKNGPHFRSLSKLEKKMSEEEVLQYLKEETAVMEEIDKMSREGIKAGEAILSQLTDD